MVINTDRRNVHVYSTVVDTHAQDGNDNLLSLYGDHFFIMSYIGVSHCLPAPVKYIEVMKIYISIQRYVHWL